MELGMLFLSSPLLLAAMAILNMVQLVNGDAHVHFYQYENVTTKYKVQAYDHSDGQCDDQRPSAPLHYGKFVSVHAKKDGHADIQTYLFENGDSSNECRNDYQACDGYAEEGDCPEKAWGSTYGHFAKTKLGGYYILFPTNSTICMAATNSTGGVAYDGAVNGATPSPSAAIAARVAGRASSCSKSCLR